MRPSSRSSVIACLPLVFAAALAGCDKPKPANEQAAAGDNAVTAAGPAPAPALPEGSKVDRSHKGAAMPAMPFAAPGGAAATLGSFRGHPVLVNFWATWCGPCVKELPTLDALGAREVGHLAVVAISEDMGGDATVAPFWKAHGMKALTPYTDAKMAMMGTLQLNELPVTILYDARGHELWRVSGGMDWAGAEAGKLLAEAG